MVSGGFRSFLVLVSTPHYIKLLVPIVCWNLQRKPIRFIAISKSFNFEKERYFEYSGIFRRLI